VSAVGDLSIDIDRLLRRIDELAEIGRVDGPDGEWGSARLALTADDQRGRDLVVTWMRDLGMSVTIDGIGNVVGTRPGSDPAAPAVMSGSHIDTVRGGGRFDGILGVLAALEVAETLEQHGIDTERPYSVVFFTNEEGARFAPDMMGSLVFAGGLSLEAALDARAVDNDARLGDELIGIGYDGGLPCPTAVAPHSFVELHIEQGPILEGEGVPIGVVEGVQGISWTQLVIDGRAAHAGTTPMRMRSDPAFVASAIGVFVRELTTIADSQMVGTVGRVEMVPNLINVVPSQVTMTVDLRDPDDTKLVEAERLLAEYCVELAAAEGVEITSTSLARFEPVEFDRELIDLLEETATSLGLASRRIASGAGHDAQVLARICPSAMIFTPSVGGVSHNIAEFTAGADIAAGANLLLQVLLRNLNPIYR